MRSLLDDVALYRVKVVDRATGAERFVSTEATTPEEAQAKVAAFGEMVGHAELVEVKRPVASTPPVPASVQSPAIARVPAPSRGIGIGGVVVAIILALLLFPIVALVLFVGGAVGIGAFGSAMSDSPTTTQTAGSGTRQPQAASIEGPTLRRLVHTPAEFFGSVVTLENVEFFGLESRYARRFESSRGLATGSVLGMTLRDDSGEFFLTAVALKDSDVGRELLAAPPGQKYRMRGRVEQFEDARRAALLVQALERVP